MHMNMMQRQPPDDERVGHLLTSRSAIISTAMRCWQEQRLSRLFLGRSSHWSSSSGADDACDAPTIAQSDNCNLQSPIMQY